MAYSFGLVPDRGAHLRSNNRAEACLTNYYTSRDKGAVERKILWIEPDFNSEHSAFYSARVLENLTCRRSMWDAIRVGTVVNSAVSATLKARTCSSSIWYIPNN